MSGNEDGFGSYGIAQETSLLSGTPDALVEEVAQQGFAVLPDVLGGADVADLNQRLDCVYRQQCEEVGGEDTLLELQDADIVRCPLAYDDTFLSLAQHPELVAATKRLLGENVVLLMQNGIINRPDRVQAQTRWHRDLNYQHWVSSAPLAISVLVCLEDFNSHTGATVFLPASHKSSGFPSADLVRNSEVQIEAGRGSMLVFDSMAFHRAGLNRSNIVRRGINHVIGRPILGQQVDIPAMLRRAVPADPWLAGYLGYRWNPVSDVRNWRLRKLAQLRAARQRDTRTGLE